MAATSITVGNDDEEDDDLYEEFEEMMNGFAASDGGEEKKESSIVDKLHAVVEEVTTHRIVKPKKLPTIGFIQ